MKIFLVVTVCFLHFFLLIGGKNCFEETTLFYPNLKNCLLSESYKNYHGLTNLLLDSIILNGKTRFKFNFFKCYYHHNIVLYFFNPLYKGHSERKEQVTPNLSVSDPSPLLL